jgi:hypothetical protein
MPLICDCCLPAVRTCPSPDGEEKTPTLFVLLDNVCIARLVSVSDKTLNSYGFTTKSKRNQYVSTITTFYEKY